MPAATTSDSNQATSIPLQDIADRLRTETLLRESEAGFRTILESAAIGISVNTSEGRPILSNPALEKMLGYTGDELRTMNYLQFTHPDDRQSETRLMADLIAGRIDSYRVEKRYICKSGRMMWGRLTVSLLHQPDEEPHHFVAMVEDITDRKRAESDSRQREAELEVIAELSLAMRQATSYPQVIESLVARAASALSARACGLLLLEDRRLKLVANWGLKSPTGSAEIPEDDSWAWQVIRSGQTVCQPFAVNGGTPPAADPIRELDPGASLVALAPLRSSDMIVGLLYLAFEQTNELSPGVRKLLDPVADIGSNAIQRAKLLQTLEQQVSDRTRRLKMLYEVSAAASQSFDLRSMLLSALQTLVAAIPGCAGCLQSLDDETSCRPALVQVELSEEIIAALEQGFLPEASWTRVLRDGLTLRLTKGVRGRRMPGLATESGLADLSGHAHPGSR